MRRRPEVVGVLLLTGCLAQPFEVAPSAVTPQEGSCGAISEVLVPKCSGCHTAARPPDLSFSGAPLGAAYVTPGDAGSSLLYRKLSGELQPDEGAQMPPGAPLSEAQLTLVRTWIEEGASVDCDAPVGPAERHHPEGFADPARHGLELKLQVQDCRDCHGPTLEGDLGPSCDSCHGAAMDQEPTAWRTDCTFCHGDREEGMPAPPRDIDGTTARESISFRAHREHVSERNHAPYDCSQCHLPPDDVLSPGHIFDDATPRQAEVRFEAGHSKEAVYLGEGQCSNLYCHGNGRTGTMARLGSFGHDLERPTCTSCHEGMDSGRDGWERMSGEHEEHLREDGVTCADCHAGTASADGRSILGPTLHVNGRVDVSLSPVGMTRAASGCSGTCHGEEHRDRSW